MITIRSIAPLRLGLAGGGTDVSPYCDLHGGAVLNATIDRYAYTTLTTTTENKVIFTAADKQCKEVIQIKDIRNFATNLELHLSTYIYFMDKFNDGTYLPIELTTYCDAPPGSGLGSSSTLVVSMIQAYVELLNIAIDDYEIGRLAYYIERVICGQQGGKQDQYSSTFGGFNFMEFYSDDKTLITPLRVREKVISELETCLLLYYTGISRDSSSIIKDQSLSIEGSSKEALNSMHSIKKETIEMKECLLKGNFKGLVESIRNGWENKKKTSRAVSNSHINSIYDDAIKAGALAGKVSGAGGGGFMYFYVPPERRMSVLNAISNYPGFTSNCHFTKRGAYSWRIQ